MSATTPKRSQAQRRPQQSNLVKMHAAAKKRGLLFVTFIFPTLTLLFFPLIGCSAPPLSDSVRAFQRNLAARDSATAALQTHCPAPIHVRHLITTQNALSPRIPTQILSLLGGESASPIRVRHVQLLCGITVLSDAWNYYLPEQLSQKTRDKLADSRIPFGRAVGETNFTRKTLSSTLLPVSSGYVLENHALLFLRFPQNSTKPFSVVIERYTMRAIKQATQ